MACRSEGGAKDCVCEDVDNPSFSGHASGPDVFMGLLKDRGWLKSVSAASAPEKNKRIKATQKIILRINAEIGENCVYFMAIYRMKIEKVYLVAKNPLCKNNALMSVFPFFQFFY